MIIDAFETEMFLFSMSAISGLHFDVLWPSFDDTVLRLSVAVKEKTLMIRATT